MKQRRNIIAGILLAFILLFLITIDVTQAEEFHVTTAAEFQDALTVAGDNGQADTIWLVAGIYLGSFRYDSEENENYDLTIKGENGTSTEDVILDGNNEYRVLEFRKDNTGSISIDGITVRNASFSGIGVYDYSTYDVTITNSIIKNITDPDEGYYSSGGTGVYTSNSGKLFLTNNTIIDNTGLGLNTPYAKEVCLISNNISNNFGGGVSVWGPKNYISLTNNIITKNRARDMHGGGVLVSGDRIILVNNTITENLSAFNGGGLHLTCYISAEISNNIIWGNGAVDGEDIYNDLYTTGFTNISNNDFQDTGGVPFTEEVNNIDADPLFTDSEQGDYHLSADSPCIDKGTDQAPELPSTDFEGNPRIIGSAPDIGADESDISAPPTTTTSVTTTSTASSQPCTSELIYGEDSEQTELLRYFRDHVLSQSPEGQELIKLYYQWSPLLLEAMQEDEEFKEEIKEMIDGILPLIEEVLD